MRTIKPTVRDVATEILDEYLKARKRHAPMHSAHEGSSVIREEFEELWEHVRADTGHTIEARKEAVQLGAMALAYILEVCD